MERDTQSAVILGAAGDPVREPTRSANQSPLPSLERGEGARGMKRLVCQRPISPNGESLLALPKSNQKASPCTPLHPAVLATGGMRQRHTKASLTLRTVCADDASTTARCSASRRGLKGQLVGPQLFGEILISCGHKAVNGYLSTLSLFGDLAHIKWVFQEKVECSLDASIQPTQTEHLRSGIED